MFLARFCCFFSYWLAFGNLGSFLVVLGLFPCVFWSCFLFLVPRVFLGFRIFLGPSEEGSHCLVIPRERPGRPTTALFERDLVTLFDADFSMKVPCSIFDLTRGIAKGQVDKN